VSEEPDGTGTGSTKRERSARRRRTSAFRFPSREFNPCPAYTNDLRLVLLVSATVGPRNLRQPGSPLDRHDLS
jgi:hypothetical protein